MEGEPVDRRGLFGQLFRQAAGAIAENLPGLGEPLQPPGECQEAEAFAEQVSTARLLEEAERLGLASRADDIERLARPSQSLTPAAGAGGEEVSFGGRPLLNAEQAWPAWNGRALTFLAEVETGTALGRLAFFYDTVGRPSGCLAAHAGTAVVLQANDARLVPAEGPAQPQYPHDGRRTSELALPNAASAAVRALALSPGERESWEALRSELAGLQGHEPVDEPGPFRVAHRLLGWPDERGGELELTCELAAAGEDVIEGRAALHERAGELREQSERWALLAQFSGDGKLGWPWVAQRVYFFADREELAVGRPGPVWAIAR